jgi:hypothetical protein
MLNVRNRRLVAGVVAVFAATTVAFAGCGGGDSGSAVEIESRPAPAAKLFPSAEGKTLREVLNEADRPSQLVLSPASQVFYAGENRYSFGVFTLDRKQVTNAQVALYFSRVPRQTGTAAAITELGEQARRAGQGKQPTPPPKKETQQSLENALGNPAIGPFPAAVQSLETKAAFRAQTTANDPDSAVAVYTTNIDLPKNGEWRIGALVREGDELTATLLPSAIVGEFTDVPRVGQGPPPIHTPTPASVGNDLSKLTTRVPPETMNQEDFADVLGKKPIVLLFATPQFCQSRTCGPVVDIASQVQQDYGDKAAFIHMEIYNDNDPSEGVRPQVRAFHLPSEPWVFVIDRSGVIRTEIEGAFGVDELTEAVKAVTGS